MFRTMWVFYLFFTGAYMQVCHGQEVILSSDTLDQWENMSITLTCFSNLTNPTGTFSWYLNYTKSDLPECFVTKDCQILSSWLANNESYSVTCTNKSVNSVTIKTISQTMHGETWKCKSYTSSTAHASNTVQILVKVPVKNATISPYNEVLTMAENNTFSWQCTTSTCRPAPRIIWYKQSSAQSGGMVTEIFNVTAASNSSLAVTLESYSRIYSIRLDRVWNGYFLFCGAQNDNSKGVLSGQILLNVTYPPDDPPRIGKLESGSTINVTKNSIVNLQCSVSGGNPLPTLEWNVMNDKPQTVYGNRVIKNISWQATDNNKQELRCQSIHQLKSDSSYVIANILYSVKVTSLYIQYTDGEAIKEHSNIDVIEGSNVKLVCNATGNPPPAYSWSCRPTANDNTVDLGILTKESSGDCTCFVKNTMEPSFEKSLETNDNSTLNINILYSPSIQRLDNVTVLEGYKFTRTCRIAPGNTEILGTRWMSAGNSMNNSNTLSFSNISRKNDTTYTCVVYYTMNPTGLEKLNLSKMENMRISVAFPPEKVAFSLRMMSGEYIVIVNTISIIENDQLFLNCSAKCNPPVSTFEWKGVMNSTHPGLHINNIRRSQTGDVICNVYNTMKLTEPNQTLIGQSNSTIHIDVLYPPKVNNLEEKTIAEGEDLVYLCHFTPGNPNSTTFVWRREDDISDTTQQQYQQLALRHVSRNQSGFYTCSVFNKMKATDGHEVLGNDSGHFKLIVEYKAKVQRFVVVYFGQEVTDNVSVNESETVKLLCIIEGRPLATGELSFREAGYLQRNNMDVQFHFQNTSIYDSETLQVVRTFEAQCTDSGIHTCTGSNELYTGLVTVRTLNITLNVNCKPRKSPFHQFPSGDIVGSATLVPVTLNFTALAYPIPQVSGYVWSRQTKETMSNWTTITSSDTSLVISTEGLQSNLTIKNVTRFDFGLYRVLVDNEIGSFEYIFNLTAAGKPEVPKDFRHIEESLTESSATFQWRPSFNGGLKQFFVLSYSQKDNQLMWKDIIIQDTDSDHMTYVASGLSSGTTYDFKLFARNGCGNSSTETISLTTKSQSNQPSNESVVGAAVGGACASAVVVIVAIILVILYRKRLQRKKPYIAEKSRELNDRNAYQNFSKGGTAWENESPSLSPRQFCKQETTFSLQELDDCVNNKEYVIYGNTEEMRKRIERVNLSELISYLTDKTVDFFTTEFAKLPQGLIYSYDDSQKPENIALNRYHGIYPYDHSRVKIPSAPEFFINACYIDGYKKKRAYIASLWPLSRNTYRFVTFWQMVWSEKSDVIVMLTKLTEPSGVKCDQYWPKEGTSETYGEITLTSEGEQVFSEYVLRKFSILKGKEKRAVAQFHFMAWPDKSVPEDVTCLLEFRRRVKACHLKGPMVVHCSAGIGRTGTLIAVDTLIEEGKSRGSVNVMECVKKMKEQRVNMVQTPDQYYYIYKALVNALVLDTDCIKAEKFHKYVDATKIDMFNNMFVKFNQSVETDSTEESNARTFNKLYKDNNRIGSDLPGDRNRVRLFLNRDMDSPGYTNAMFLNSLTKPNHFIVAQSPLVNGAEDFLCLIYQEECTCVVSMDGGNREKTVGLYLPPDNSDMKLGNFNVKCTRLDTKESYVVRKMKIEFTGKVQGGEKTVYHFQYTGWSEGHIVPSDVQTVVDLTIDVENFIKQFGTEESHVLVHCLNAYERSCLFCAIAVLTEKIQYEGEVCVANTLRQIRTRRKLAFPNMEQFMFCFKAVEAYINMNKTGYANAENSYMNMALNQA